MTIAEIPYGSLREIPTFAWIITVGSKAYIYTGSKSGLAEAVSRVKNDKWSAGSTVRTKLVVK